MSRWGSYSEETPSIDYTQLITSHPNAIELLQLPEFVANVKSRSTKFTQKIVESQNRAILLQFIEIAINPSAFMHRTQTNIDNKLAHGAIEVLTNLSEQFIEAVFEEGNPSEDEVVQGDREYPILDYIMKLLSPTVEDTGLAYLSKLLTPFIYQRPQQMLQVFSSGGIKVLTPYFWSASVADLVTKLIEAEGEDDFFEKQKLLFVNKVCVQVGSIESVEVLQSVIEHFGDIIESLVEKHEDKYQRGKYSKLIKGIVEDNTNFSFLLSQLDAFGQHRLIRTELLRCVYSFLKIHQPVKHSQSEENEKQSALKVDNKFMSQLKNYLLKHPPTYFQSSSRLQLLNFYKLVKEVLTLDPTSSSELVSEPFITSTLTLMKADPSNNVLHNYQKDILLAALSQSPQVGSILRDQTDIYSSLKSNLSDGSCKISYAAQLFLLGQALKNRSEASPVSQNWSQLEEALESKRKFYSVLIGGKPGANSGKWDSFEQELILKPLGPSPEEPVKKPMERTPYMMVSRLDELEGTQVLSEEEEDPFNQKAQTQQSHFYDDDGLPQLPLDSDRSEEEDGKGLLDVKQSIVGAKKVGGVKEEEQKSDFFISQNLTNSINMDSQQERPEKQNNNLHVERVNSIVAITIQSNQQSMTSNFAENQTMVNHISPFKKSTNHDQPLKSSQGEPSLQTSNLSSSNNQVEPLIRNTDQRQEEKNQQQNQHAGVKEGGDIEVVVDKDSKEDKPDTDTDMIDLRGNALLVSGQKVSSVNQIEMLDLKDHQKLQSKKQINQFSQQVSQMGGEKVIGQQSQAVLEQQAPGQKSEKALEYLLPSSTLERDAITPSNSQPTQKKQDQHLTTNSAIEKVERGNDYVVLTQQKKEGDQEVKLVASQGEGEESRIEAVAKIQKIPVGEVKEVPKQDTIQAKGTLELPKEKQWSWQQEIGRLLRCRYGLQ